MKARKPLLLSAVSLLLLAGCGGTSQVDSTTLNVILYDAGWGSEWFKDIVARWESENPGYKVNLTAKYEVNNLINRHLSSKNNPDDLYIATDSGWRNDAFSGKFASLDDLMDEEVDGMKFSDKINDEYKDNLYLGKDSDKHVYRLPWTSGMGGIYYNAKMFRDNGWEVPTTTEELSALVKTILEAKVEVVNDDTNSVKPFVYTGKNTDYFDYAVFNWWMQLEGYDSIKNFYKYDDLDKFNYESTANSVYGSLKTVVDYWRTLFTDVTLSDGDTVSTYVNGSLSYGNHDAQTDFFNGKAAMIFDGDWLYNETLNYGTNSNFELGFMKTPTFTNAIETNVSYIIGSDQYVAIPASSKKQDLAKSLIKTMVSNWSLSNFTNKSHGFLAYKNTDTSAIDLTNSYVKSYMDVRNSITKTTNDESSADIYLNGYVSNAWVTSSNRPFEGLLSQSEKSVESSFKTIFDSAKQAFSRGS